MDKSEILNKIAQMPLEVIDRKRDEKLLELREIQHKLYLVKDEEVIMRHTKRKKLLEEKNSPSRTENMLRQDEELYAKKRVIMNLSDLVKEKKLELEVLNGAFWRAKA